MVDPSSSWNGGPTAHVNAFDWVVASTIDGPPAELATRYILKLLDESLDANIVGSSDKLVCEWTDSVVCAGGMLASLLFGKKIEIFLDFCLCSFSPNQCGLLTFFLIQ